MYVYMFFIFYFKLIYVYVSNSVIRITCEKNTILIIVYIINILYIYIWNDAYSDVHESIFMRINRKVKFTRKRANKETCLFKSSSPYIAHYINVYNMSMFSLWH